MKTKKIKIFIDSADTKTILGFAKNLHVKGFTTNPSFMRLAGVVDYKKFAKNILKNIKGLPISFEVIADDFASMENQARLLASWGKNVYVKIPITNTKKESSFDLVKKLSDDKIKLNITAVTTFGQIKKIAPAINPKTPAIISIFAGRIADTGKDPAPIVIKSAQYLKKFKNIKLLWASYREIINFVQAEKCGCDIITVRPDLIEKLKDLGKPLLEVSLDTVRKFYKDANDSKYKL
jgi:transaldolase